jgi:V/A-type H+-transporting ATPase subunit I
MKPLEMTKISITAPKNQLRRVVEGLYELQLMDIEDHEGDVIESGKPFEEAEQLSETIVDIRSLISKLPEQDKQSTQTKDLGQVQNKATELEEKVENIQKKIDRLSNQSEKLDDRIKTLEKLKGVDLNYEDLSGTKNLGAVAGDLDTEKLKKKCSENDYKLFRGKESTVAVYREEKNVEEAVNSCIESRISLPELDYEGPIKGLIDKKKEEKQKVEDQIREKEDELENISREWRGSLVTAEEFLSQKVEKAEAPINFGTTENAFIAKGWIPSEKLDELKEKMCDITDGKIYVEEEEGENPPVEYDNGSIVEPFESLTDLMSRPSYNEVDPSIIIFATFPIFFGAMVGDIGYGLVSFAAFYIAMKKIPSSSMVMKSMMFSSAASILFGFVFGEFFGYKAFSSGNIFQVLTGSNILENIPVLFDKSVNAKNILYASAAAGLVHVNLGYLTGFYNKYTNQGISKAILSKGSWFILQVSVFLAATGSMVSGLTGIVSSIAMMTKGNGVKGVVMIPTLLTRILSYLRIGAVIIAGGVLIKVLMGMTNPLLTSGSIITTIFGIAILLVGHVFITMIKILQGFLQGIRLHYAEMFGTFYEGGGKRYAPFGAQH